jgi:hypothetical protein
MELDRAGALLPSAIGAVAACHVRATPPAAGTGTGLVSGACGLQEADAALADGSADRDAQYLRRMLDRGELREEAMPGCAIGYVIADDRIAQSASGGEGASRS